MGLCASVIGLYICLTYRNTLVVYQTTNMINDKIFDGYLITLGDYSVQGKISQHHWNTFLAGMKTKGVKDEHYVVAFERILEEQIQEWLMRNDKN